MSLRIGHGYDIHRLVPGRPLRLGCLEIPYPKGLLGHSDADVAAHALVDAILGAAGLGDLGTIFPDTDSKWEGASGDALLSHTADLLRARGSRFLQADLTVIAEAPRLEPFRDRMRRALSDAVRGSSDSVNVKFRTHEGLGEIGRGDAIAAHAVALVEVPDSSETAG